MRIFHEALPNALLVPDVNSSRKNDICLALILVCKEEKISLELRDIFLIFKKEMQLSLLMAGHPPKGKFENRVPRREG